MRNQLVAMTAAIFCAGALAVAQSACAPGQTSNRDESGPGAQAGSPAAAEAQQTATTTLTGCVYRERDVPGRTPDVAGRAGGLEHYILAEVTLFSAASPSAEATSTAGDTPRAGASGERQTAATTGLAGAPASRVAEHPMYTLEHGDDERLQALAGKRVEVVGRVDAERGDLTSSPTVTSGSGVKPSEHGSVGPARIELPGFEISTIREIAGTCPASPSTR